MERDPLPYGRMYSFSIAAITNYHKFTRFKKKKHNNHANLFLNYNSRGQKSEMGFGGPTSRCCQERILFWRLSGRTHTLAFPGCYRSAFLGWNFPTQHHSSQQCPVASFTHHITLTLLLPPCFPLKAPLGLCWTPKKI